MNNLPVSQKSSRNQIVGLFELTHNSNFGQEEEPLWIRSFREHKKIWVQGNKIFEHMGSEADFIELFKTTEAYKYLYKHAVNVQLEVKKDDDITYCQAAFWESIKEWLEQQARRGMWEL